jgi:hypothetical protein
MMEDERLCHRWRQYSREARGRSTAVGFGCSWRLGVHFLVAFLKNSLQADFSVSARLDLLVVLSLVVLR